MVRNQERNQADDQKPGFLMFHVNTPLQKNQDKAQNQDSNAHVNARLKSFSTLFPSLLSCFLLWFLFHLQNGFPTLFPLEYNSLLI